MLPGTVAGTFYTVQNLGSRIVRVGSTDAAVGEDHVHAGFRLFPDRDPTSVSVKHGAGGGIWVWCGRGAESEVAYDEAV